MLKLKKIQILGFKSFCDRTEVQLPGEGIAAVVGPNGCGKSNISDAIIWVLGEQSAKSLRGLKMEDVIFAGTHDRKPTGMAEVSLTLVDPEVYDGTPLHQDGPELVMSDRHPVEDSAAETDWDEPKLREQIAAETEAAVAEAQPGVILDDEEADAPSQDIANSWTDVASENVVLKIRRRKFNRAPVRAGEITVTRRLFRTGDSEYLLNGKICRLRDIQDIFMGTGLGGESYAIIGQERIGQLLSSKPHDRRSIIEEAAGITRFKTKKRLAELRLESARQNLSRVNDIFDEVTRQMSTLKRQATKAERYGQLRDELRGKLRIAVRSRMAQFDMDLASATSTIVSHTTSIDERAGSLEILDSQHTDGVQRGYALDGLIRETNATASQTAVDLERVSARAASNADRIADLTAHLETGAGDLTAAREQLAQLGGELEQHKSFLEGANAESTIARDAAQHQQTEAANAVRAVANSEHLAEQSRRHALHLMQRANATRNEIAQAEASLAGLETEAERLSREADAAREELSSLGLQRGQVRLSFESVTERLGRLETEIATLRLDTEARRKAESESKRRGDHLRSELASLNGRRHSLEGLIRDHSYSTDTVKNIFRSAKKSPQLDTSSLAPVGTLADFLEVEGQFGAVVDEFLREELNFVVVNGWDAADEGIRLLRSDVTGRATFFVHPPEPATHAVTAAEENRPQANGLVPLRDCVRVLNGFGDSLQTLLPKLRNGFVATDATQARELSLQHPHAWFLTPTGETFHALTVTAGRTTASGPLTLKRDLRELSTKASAIEANLSQTDIATATLAREIAQASSAIEAKTQERREAEREVANSGAALRQMDSEAQRIERRLGDWQLSSERNRDQRNAKADLIARKRTEAEAADREHHALEASLVTLQQQVTDLRTQRERLQAAAAAAAATAAGIEERRRNAQANFDQTNRLLHAQTNRLQQLDSQLATAAAERTRREEETSSLATQASNLAEAKATATAEAARFTIEARELRTYITDLDVRLRALRSETNALREQRAQLSAQAAKLSSNIEHIEATCLNDLGTDPASLREDTSVALIAGDALSAQEQEARTLKGKLEVMGPVNMMALEEYHETTERHAFLETQRKDLLDSIENTQASIKEIDDVSRIKFDEAFKVINENFSLTFTKLFGGGQALMKLTDIENSAESGIDIVASPPGKKLQSILLLSGGEKALTALSLLVGIFQFQPAPFCILDEVDAPLDETNVGRFAKLIDDMSTTTQFIVITHSKRTMAQADIIYGVTMQEPGVSKIVSVNLANRRASSSRRAVA
jgi:chromosome segregation protein